MPYLLIVTALWAFSFSLIGVYLAGQVDAYFSVLTRIALASLVFLPFLRRRWLRPDLVINRQQYGGQSYYIIKDPVGLKYFRFREEELFLLSQLDGRSTLDDVPSACGEWLSPAAGGKRHVGPVREMDLR